MHQHTSFCVLFSYYHRSLNPKKLIETGFSHLGRNKSMALTVKLYKVPDAPKIPGFRPLEERDIPQVCRKLKAYTDQFSLTAVLSEEECRHWLLPRAGVMYSYVVQVRLFIVFCDLRRVLLIILVEFLIIF